ncbi:S-adenosylmethionine:tRNA ribosyltransferase-isomerase [Glycomyces sp. TRM65418]|uniref:S-adenosylmethionine:tRNA ribosyltransferase-isomerase n=1 Tax=Glycomyces sp. TRM65418 TaxID=2867006 RepID=UPI001D1674EA|nr:S-adenosylmethionine:tRNA ribosyltransferase-isomerase [Glycomyces sp. TRM65418]MCC3761712.1 S-adenosylmethionine:tRNA ribosyltransferase-isomerase [Glycomyces sp. TRM65418]
MSTTLTSPFEFALDAALEADQPAEVRGASRSDVRLLVSDKATGAIAHRHFEDLPSLVRPGDLLVVNNSTTLPAAVPTRQGLGVHFSSTRPDGSWLVELRDRGKPYLGEAPGGIVDLPGGVALRLERWFGKRLWVTRPPVESVPEYLARHGRPIRYSYLDRAWPLSAYQTAFATVPGSAEMPSAARPFTPEIVTRLVSAGVGIAPITLHTGVASLESDEDPYPEWFEVGEYTARAVNAARAAGARVIAVGTTAVRALESAVVDGRVVAASGHTDRIVSRANPVAVVDGLLTGFHEPRSTHLSMLEAIGDTDLLRESYTAAIGARYLWHEFGDVHLIA